MKILKKATTIVLAAAMLIPSITFAKDTSKTEDKYGSAKNVILMIPDGMSVEITTAARWLKDDFSLTLDSINTGTVRTNNSDTPIADSAPAATAMATGFKTVSPFISTYPIEGGMPGAEGFDKSRELQPLATVLEAAKRTGRSTGIVSTSNIQHATPAAFSSHNPDRNKYQILGEQQVYQGMDVVLGAGSKHLDKSVRDDKEDLIAEVKNQGYDYITTRDELLKTNSKKLWGMFNPSAMAYDIDRDKKIEPSIDEMASKALDILSKNDKGFFIMIEGSEIDWGAHANDPVATVTDTLAFDKAVKVCKDFVDSHEDSVLVVAADHGTGGMTYGHENLSKGYDHTKLEKFIGTLKGAKLTCLGASKKLNADRSNITDIYRDYFGITDLTEDEINSVKNAKEKDLQSAIGRVISDRSHIGWTTHGHVGGDIALYCHTNGKNLKELKGNIFNKDIGNYLADVLDVNLAKLTSELYIPARQAFEKKGAEVKYIENGKANFELQVTKGSDKYIFPIDKNYAIVNGNKTELNGLVLNTTRTCYVPQSAVDLVK